MAMPWASFSKKILQIGNDVFSEGNKGEFGQFETLQPERYADNSNAKDDAAYQVAQAKLEPCKDEPNDVDDGRPRAAAVDDLAAKGEKRHGGEFKTLFAERNADNRYAQDKPPKDPCQSRFPAD